MTTINPDLVQPAPPEQPARPAAPAQRTGGRRPDAVGAGLFRAFWRWHFYASFIVVPVLLVLAVTGLLYMLRLQIEPLMHGDLMKVDVPPGAVALPYEEQRTAVVAAYPDAALSAMTEPSGPDRSTSFSTGTGEQEREVYVDPYTARVLGELDPQSTVSGTARRLHKDLMAGTWGGHLMELGSCWAIVMALTGYYMYWRGRVARSRRSAAKAAGATLRSRHALAGLSLGAGLLALVVTGLPWTQVWGAKVQALATGQGSSLWSQDHGAASSAPTLDASLPHSHALPWAQEGQSVPKSIIGPVARGARTQPAGIDVALGTATAAGVARPTTMALPTDPEGVYSVMGYAFYDPTAEKTVHVDQFTGRQISAYGYDEYAGLAKAVSQGIALHEGRRFGVLNTWGAGLFCVGITFMCITGPLMWWRRRPKGNVVGAPRGKLALRTDSVLAIGVLALGVALPLFGLSLVVVLLLDQLVLRRLAPLRRFFAVA